MQSRHVPRARANRYSTSFSLYIFSYVIYQGGHSFSRAVHGAKIFRFTNSYMDPPNALSSREPLLCPYSTIINFSYKASTAWLQIWLSHLATRFIVTLSYHTSIIKIEIIKLQFHTYICHHARNVCITM